MQALPQDILDKHVVAQDRLAEASARHRTWLPTRLGPTPLIDGWDEARGGSALAFVQAFTWDPIDEAHRGLDVHFTMIAGHDSASAAAIRGVP